MKVRVRNGGFQVSLVIGMGAVMLLSSCAIEPGRLTGLGGAAGGALGAGLGALVGSQAGDPTTGLIMGGAAGSVAGAAAGNVFDAEEAEIAEKNTVVRNRDRDISRGREQIAALRTRDAASDFDLYDDYPVAPRRSSRDSMIRNSLGQQTSERRAPSPSILRLDSEDERPIYVERRAGGRQRGESSSERGFQKDLQQARSEKPQSSHVAEAAVMPRRASSPVKEEMREVNNAWAENTARRNGSQDTTASIHTAPVRTAPVQTSPVKIVPPVRKALGVPTENRNEETTARSNSQASKQSAIAKPVEREKVTRAAEQPAKPARRESRVVSEERQPDTMRAIRSVDQVESSSRGPAPVKSDPKGMDWENARRVAAKSSASLLKKELTVLAKQPVPVKDKPLATRREELEAPVSTSLQVNEQPKQSSAENSTGKRASGECGQASQEIEKSNQVSEPAEKLFHFRRALRLCPSDARYHVHLGDHYRSLKRLADANFEYKEALALDPSNTEVKQKVEELKNG